MKIGIMADSRDNLVKIKRTVEIFNKEKIDLLLNTGDFVSPFIVRELKNIQCPFVCLIIMVVTTYSCSINSSKLVRFTLGYIRQK
jgi:predicted phosphodiesterase